MEHIFHDKRTETPVGVEGQSAAVVTRKIDTDEAHESAQNVEAVEKVSETIINKHRIKYPKENGSSYCGRTLR